MILRRCSVPSTIMAAMRLATSLASRSGIWRALPTPCCRSLMTITKRPSRWPKTRSTSFRPGTSPRPAWRFGTLPNGLRYAVRRNALPEGQVSIRLRIDAGVAARGGPRARLGAFRRAYAVPRHREFRRPARRARPGSSSARASAATPTRTTEPTQTVYSSTCPMPTAPPLDTSLDVLAEMMTRARVRPAAVAAERPVVLAEKGRRPELSQRFRETSWPLFYRRPRYRDRDTIGTEATLNGATAEGLRAFYGRWYRPERATVVMVGDADPALMEELIAARFGGWKAEGPAPAEPDYGRIAEPRRSRSAALAYPGVAAIATADLGPALSRPRRTPWRASARSSRRCSPRRSSTAGSKRMPRGESAFLNAPRRRDPQRAASPTDHLIRSRRGTARWREGADRGLRDHRRRACARRRARPRSPARCRISAPPPAPPCRARRPPSRRIRAERLVAAVDSNAVVATAPTALDNFEAQCAGR